jgi:hypothetical protein
LDGENLPAAVAEIPWGHHVVLVFQLKDPLQRLWYAQQTVQHGWSRSILELQISRIVPQTVGRFDGVNLSQAATDIPWGHNVIQRRAGMNAIKATVQGGRIELQAPPDWPDGTEVIVQPVSREDQLGIREEDWQDTPEAVAAWLKWYDSLEPLVFTDEERVAWETARREQKEFEKATFAERAEKLRRVWE